MTDLQKLRELAERATPGPWSYDVDEDEIHSESCATSDGEPWHVIPSQTSQSVASIRDSQFIAAANPQAIIEILDMVDRYMEALSTIETLSSYPNRIFEIGVARAELSKINKMAREALDGDT